MNNFFLKISALNFQFSSATRMLSIYHHMTEDNTTKPLSFERVSHVCLFTFQITIFGSEEKCQHVMFINISRNTLENCNGSLTHF